MHSKRVLSRFILHIALTPMLGVLLFYSIAEAIHAPTCAETDTAVNGTALTVS